MLHNYVVGSDAKSEAIDTNQSVALMVVKVTINNESIDKLDK